MKNTFAEREKNNEANRLKYNIACNEFAIRYGFLFSESMKGVIFSKTAGDADMVYTIERWSRMSVATVLRITSKELSKWIRSRTSGAESTAFYELIIRYDSDYSFYPENIDEYLSEIASTALPVLEICKKRPAIIHHILNNPCSSSLPKRTLDYLLCFGSVNEIKSFITNSFSTSDKVETAERLKTEALNEKQSICWLRELALL